ncbi:MAG: hypothetical protein ACLQB1_21765 [Streptosporangiaceae bacterium]
MNPSKHQLSGYGWRPADPPRRPVLFINPRSGDGKAERAGLAGQARAKGIEAIILAPGQDLAALAREAAAAGADALGMAGGGQLGIVVLDAPGDSPHSPGQAWTAPRLEVNAPAPVHAGVDGEAVDLSPPLRFAIRPAALRVRICPRHPGASPSARLHLPGYPPA